MVKQNFSNGDEILEQSRKRTTILIAEDDTVSRRMLTATLSKWDYDIRVVCDGMEAWKVYQKDGAPKLAILDWMMPGMDGVTLCRKIRERKTAPYIYIILLTAKGRTEDIVDGLDAGADDYITKPFSPKELHARVRVGIRVLNLQQHLADHVQRLEEAMARVKQLQGLLPICAYCNKIRDDKNYWQNVEHYITEHSEAQFSHSICPDCYEKIIKKEFKELK